jgi:hypothetical protein
MTKQTKTKKAPAAPKKATAKKIKAKKSAPATKTRVTRTAKKVVRQPSDDEMSNDEVQPALGDDDDDAMSVDGSVDDMVVDEVVVDVPNETDEQELGE